MDIKERIDKCVDKFKEYAGSPEAFAVLFVKKHLKTFKWIKITDYDYIGDFGFKKLKFTNVKCELFERTITPSYPPKSNYKREKDYIRVCRAITWETAHRDISLQEKKGVKGEPKTLTVVRKLISKPKKYKRFVLKDYTINYKELQLELDKFGAKAIEKIPEASRKYIYETKVRKPAVYAPDKVIIK